MGNHRLKLSLLSLFFLVFTSCGEQSGIQEVSLSSFTISLDEQSCLPVSAGCFYFGDTRLSVVIPPSDTSTRSLVVVDTSTRTTLFEKLKTGDVVGAGLCISESSCSELRLEDCLTDDRYAFEFEVMDNGSPGIGYPTSTHLGRTGVLCLNTADRDLDGITDDTDNCPDVSNADQIDIDNDGVGNLCDVDFISDGDTDGVINGEDNCPDISNADQSDADNDGVGDTCDSDFISDADADGVEDSLDNCPNITNADQADVDTDGIGDACDSDFTSDADVDGVINGQDNCPNTANTDQSDIDADGVGDLCDPDFIADTDSDGIVDGLDNCPNIPNRDQADIDGDGIGNICDDDFVADRDLDGVLDEQDNCPDVINTNQSDLDQDGIGDACDVDFLQADRDLDSIIDNLDNCPDVPNRSQADTDGDGTGDACELDSDNDEVPNETDNCPQVPNADQLDSDGDGIGDACDGLEPSFARRLRGGGIIAAGVGLGGRPQSTSAAEGTISVPELPSGAEVVSAQLYWATIGGADDTVTLNSQNVSGTLIGQAGDTCWTRPVGNFAYRADISSLFTGSGDYAIAGLVSDVTGFDGQGASIVVIYSIPSSPLDNYISLAENIVAASNQENLITTVSGFEIPPNFIRATALNIVGDGQSFADSLSFNTRTLPTPGPYFTGTDGTYWDTRFDDVSSFVNTGDRTLLVRLDYLNDCLVWVVSGIVVEAPATQNTDPAENQR